MVAFLTAYSMTTTGQFKLLHTFVGNSADGGFPGGKLIDVNGVLYGDHVVRRGRPLPGWIRDGL